MKAEVESRDLRSLKRDRVASFEELMIANRLHLKGIAYEYEPTYEHKLTGTERRACMSELDLTEKSLYPKHLGFRKKRQRDGTEELVTGPFIDNGCDLGSCTNDQFTHLVVLCMNIFSSYKTQCMIPYCEQEAA